jgi:hypothetical protein
MTDENFRLVDDLQRFPAEPFPAGDAGTDEIYFLLRHGVLLLTG